jgi:predicted nucleic acid-binding protein
MRVFLDANILFSAAKCPGAIRQLVEQIQIRGHECLADDYVIAEARRNSEQKFPAALPDFESLLRGIYRLASPPALSAPSLELLLPEKDRPVLASAIQHRCQALLTGDKTHFGRLYGQTIAGVSICPPQGLAEILAGETVTSCLKAKNKGAGK